MKTLFDSVDNLESAMTFHRERHGVLAGNLANIDTPGYQPRDLERVAPPAVGGAPAIEMARTSPGHLDAAGGTSGDETRTFEDPAASTSADGNAVNLEREMSKMAANKLRYSTTTEVASRRLALLRYASTDGQG